MSHPLPPTVADPAARVAPASVAASATALAAVLVEQGRPLEFRRVALPSLAEGEMLVRVTACSLCGSDLHTAHGRRPHVVPTILGHEIIGRVAAVGPGEPVRDVAGVPLTVGERITWSVCASCGTCDRCRRDLPQKCRSLFKYGHSALDGRYGLSGGLADHVHLVPGTAVVRIPDGLSDAAAAPASCAMATAAAIIRTAGDVRGRTVVVFGAGMVGLAVASLARARGAGRVTIVDPQADRLERAALAVPGCAVGTQPTADPADGSDGADVVVEASGVAASVSAALDLVATGGTCVLAGTVSPVGTVAFDPERVVRRQVSIHGVHNYRPEDLVVAVSHLAGPDGVALAGLVGPIFPLDRVHEALAVAASGTALRVVVAP